MHFKHGDASSMLKSLDIPWWFLYRKLITFEATVEDHSSVILQLFVSTLLTNIFLGPEKRRPAGNGHKFQNCILHNQPHLCQGPEHKDTRYSDVSTL